MRYYEKVLAWILSEQCVEANLVRLLEARQRMLEERGEGAIICTALFFMTIWPSALEQAWTKRRSDGLAR